MSSAKGWKDMYRVPQNGLLFGVCAGVAEHFGWRPQLVRIVLFIAVVAAGWPLLVYLAAAYVLPTRDRLDVRQFDAEDLPARPRASSAAVRERFGRIDRRLRDLEAYFHSEEYSLRQKFRELEI